MLVKGLRHESRCQLEPHSSVHNVSQKMCAFVCMMQGLGHKSQCGLEPYSSGHYVPRKTCNIVLVDRGLDMSTHVTRMFSPRE